MTPIRLGIFGWPARHSKSPAMHHAAGRACGLDVRYEIFEVAPEALGEEVARQRELGITGFNVTLPHKAAMLEMVDGADDSAQAIGAVNTVVCNGARMHGHNTDAEGLVRSIVEANVDIDGAKVVVVGAGGAARAAVAGLAHRGAREVQVLARKPEKAKKLAQSLASHHARASIESDSLATAATHFADADLVIQATSATLHGNPVAEAFASGLALEALPPTATVVDLVYKPRRTTVLQKADALGLHTVDGLGMLLHQGAIAFELWTGVAPPLDAMRTAIEEPTT